MVNSVGSTNTLIQQIYQLNSQIKTANASGDQASALLDQRDTALSNLSQVMGIKTTTNSDGSVNVSTTDGVNLVSNTYAQLSYSGGSHNGSYGNINIQDVNPANGSVIGSPQALDPASVERLAQGHDRHARPGAWAGWARAWATWRSRRHRPSMPSPTPMPLFRRRPR